MATYLVTGGCGFIGSHLCDALIARGHRIRVLDDLSNGSPANLDPRAELFKGDVDDPDTVAACAADVDGIYHLAAVTSVARANEAWIATHRTNLTGTIAVLDAARRGRAGPIPVVFASSAAVYGASDELPLVENGSVQPISAYGADKLGCELHARIAGLVHGVPTVGLRFFNVYGPRQDPQSQYSGVISIFWSRLKRGLPLQVFGDGRQERDFVYVHDVVRALVLAMGAATPNAPLYNVCTGTATSVLELARLLGTLFGREPVVEFKPPRPGDIRRSVGNPTRIEAELGWRPRTPLHTGLEAMITAAESEPALATG